MKDIKDIATKLLNIEKEISYNKGPFNLFALFLRDEENKWDLLVSSEWIDQEKYESLKYIASKIQIELTQEELREISGIEIVYYDNPALDAIYRTISTEHSMIEVENKSFFGVIIRHAYFITSKKAIKKILA